MHIIDADGTDLGLYRKSHIPDGPGYEEKFYFNPGDIGFKDLKLSDDLHVNEIDCVRLLVSANQETLCCIRIRCAYVRLRCLIT